MKKFFALRAVIIALGIVSAMSALGGCHGSDFYDGWGRTRQDYETNPYADELPKLTDLRIVPCDKKGNVTGEPLLLSPVFSPSVNMYTVVMNDAMLFGGQYKVLPKSKYDISEDAMRFVKYTYVNGPQFAPVTASYVIVTISNGDLKTSYIVSFENPMLEKAKLKSLDFSEGEIVTPVQGFHPDLTSYEVEVPFGLTSVHAIAAPEVNSARVIYSDAPLRLEAGKVNSMMIQVAAAGYNTNTYSITFKEGAARDSYIEYFENSIGSLEPDFRRDIYNYTLTIPPSKPLVVRGHMAPGGTMTFNQGIERPNGTRLMQTPKDGTDLLITANNGVGYKSKTYTFSIEIDPTAKFAELETLSVVVSPFTAGAFNKLYKIEDGGRTSEGFVSAIRSYEYFMETGQPISGSLQFSATAPSVMGDNPTITFLPEADAFRRYPFDIRIPERVKVEAAGYMPVVYHVFFNSPDAY
ncbi:MAG: cadherin-like beta sandwich domain-containing protein, partial [Spirochaetaceae bacterium]|nr:cadherin-like beta sandwich domain-containing protein [Spirochaetaceae bacterium]